MNLEELEYICTLVFASLHIPIVCLDVYGEVAIELSSSKILNPLWPKNELRHAQLIHRDDPMDFPVLRETMYLEIYALFRCGAGTVILGPILYTEPTEGTIDGLMNDQRIARKHKNALLAYYKNIPVKSRADFMQAIAVLYYMIFQQKLDATTVIQNTATLSGCTEMENSKVDVFLSEQRQNHIVHSDPWIEQRFFQCIRDGNKEVMIQYFPGFGEGVGVLSTKSQVRNRKNLAIAGITLATRAAMDGGLLPELAYAMSDLLIQTLEELTSLQEIDKLLFGAMCDFADQVSHCKQNQYSKPVAVCANYILTHLYAEIAVLQLAQLTNLSPSRLSQLFRREVGLSVSKYIQQEKIKEAKKLLTLSDRSLSEICTLLNFHDQSHFTKVFKRLTGTTPRRYKNGSAHTVQPG